MTTTTTTTATRGSRGEQVWVNTNIADGGHNGFDLGDPCFRLSGFQQGQTMVSYDPKNQLDMNWTSDTHFVLYGGEANAFIGVANDDHTVAHRLWSARQHAFRSDNQGRNPILTKQTHREHCNVWYGDADVDDNGVYEPAKDICDDWTPLGDPGPNGRLTHGPYGATKAGGYVSVDRARLGRPDALGRDAGRPRPGLEERGRPRPGRGGVRPDRRRRDGAAERAEPVRVGDLRRPEGLEPRLDRRTAASTRRRPAIAGHVFEVRYVPGASTFRLLDGNEPRDRMGDIPATSVAVSDSGTIYVGTDYGCVASKGDGVWRQCGSGLPRMPVADLIYVRDQMRPPYKGKERLYAATHGQGVWELKTGRPRRDDDETTTRPSA